MGVLQIHLDKVTDLKDADTLGKSDPFVRFNLEQDNMVFDKDYGNKQSTKKKDDLNPVYDETFTYSDIPTLKNMVLSVKVMDDDIISDDKIGKCKIKLDKLGLDEGPITQAWVVDRNIFSKHARIYMTLTWTE